ncbi:LLM class flavin-dependent oxidoreductase [Williamsia muralis]|uniref:LLM class flavin-dependent oxidoreductase n=1 Tax=Williamsia marianensis TaxID=85044 RepID=UPI000DE6F3A1|nr:LLM class flavin-dependent oxidoreductase [Williamsia marianensis]PVY30757.1 luciferase-like monooxygenase [Williamsia marianensis]
MRYGISILPDQSWHDARPKWERAEEIGFDHAWVFDHLVWGGLPDARWFSSVPTMTALAMVTSTIKIGSFVVSPNFRHPVSFSREVETLLDIAGDRVLLGLGAGGTPDDGLQGAPAMTPRQKVDRFQEFTLLLDRLLTDDHVSADGEYYQARDMRLVGGSVRHRVPFILAGNGPRSIRFAVRHGDAWMTTGQKAETLDEWFDGVKRGCDHLDEALAEEGRSPDGFDRYLNLDASPQFSLTSLATFDDMVGRAGELGFTDVIIHWPRDGDPFRGSERVLDALAERGFPPPV